MITLKEYAENKKVSYEAIRKQVKRYKVELGEHIIQDGRQQFLDDVAIKFLDEKRLKNPVILEQADKNVQIEELENSIKMLLSEKSVLEKELREALKWKADKSMAIAIAEQNQLRLEEKTKENGELQKDLQEANRTIEQLRKDMEAEICEAKKELEAEKNKKLTFKERLFGKKFG